MGNLFQKIIPMAQINLSKTEQLDFFNVYKHKEKKPKQE